jgi:hypothetical protein
MEDLFLLFITDKTLWTIIFYGYVGVNLMIAIGIFFKYIEGKIN